MATIKKSPRTRTRGKPAKKPVSTRNLKQPESRDLKLLQFQVPSEIHTEFKIYAAMNGMTMVELFNNAYQFYKSKH